MNKILVLCDFSKQTLIALDIAVQIAEKMGGSVVLYHVLNFPSFGEFMDDLSHIENLQDLSSKMKDEARNKMDDIIAENFSDKGIVCEVTIGNVLREILTYQKKEKFDLMILGTKKKSSFGAHYFGSFMDRLVHRSIIPVLAIHKEIKFSSIRKTIVANAFKINEEHLSDKITKVKTLFSNALIDLVRLNTPTDFMSEAYFDARVESMKEKEVLANCSFHFTNHSDQGSGLMYYASKRKADLIVIGDKHSSTLRRWIIGEDLAEHVMDFSYTPVLIF